MSHLHKVRLEREFGYPRRPIIGVDEVGRGCLAGPVVAAAVVLPKDPRQLDLDWLSQVDDSKKIKPALREELAQKIKAWAASFCIAEASVAEIDEINILHASLLAMKRAVDGLGEFFSHAPILVDGHMIPQGLESRAKAIVKGDQNSLAIACASIIAKVDRDQKMQKLDMDYPGYELSRHKGYPTVTHLEALAELGISPLHRKSFGPVQKLL